MKMADEEYIMM